MNFILVVYFKKERSWGMVLARMMDTYLTYLPTYLPSSDGEVDSGQNVTSADLKLPLLTNSIHTILPTLPY